MTPVRFDDALAQGLGVVTSHLEAIGGPVIVVRDLLGRLHVVIDDRDRAPLVDSVRAALSEALGERLGAFAAGKSARVRLASQMIDPEAVLQSEDALLVPNTDGRVRLIERTVIGADWTRPALLKGEPANPRVTLFGIKGGVGRSTAAAVLALRWARSSRRVLLIDLDLESPGVSTLLLPQSRYPDYGIVDYFMESAVGQGEGLLAEMAAPSPFAAGASGDIIVAPASGRSREGYDFLEKLARCYLEVSHGGQTLDFAHRLSSLITALEAHYRPDVTILDSRAGLHDIAATAVTRLKATSLLFARGTPQTWLDYDILLERWGRHPALAQGFRERLKVVAAFLPETEALAALSHLKVSAYDCFQRRLYEEQRDGGMEGFNFDLDDDAAPHKPLPIYHMDVFQRFNPLAAQDTLQPSLMDTFIDTAFGPFVEGVHRLVFGEELS